MLSYVFRKVLFFVDLHRFNAAYHEVHIRIYIMKIYIGLQRWPNSAN